MSDYGVQFPVYLMPDFAESMLPLAKPFSERAEVITDETKRMELSGLFASQLITEDIGGLTYSLPNHSANLDHLIRIGIQRIKEVIQALINSCHIQYLKTYNDSYKPILAFVEKIARLPGSVDALFTNRNHIIIIDKENDIPIVRFLDETLNQSLDSEISNNPGRGCLALKIKDDDGVSIFESLFKIIFETIKMKLFQCESDSENL